MGSAASRACLVTGASRGIGRATARMLAPRERCFWWLAARSTLIEAADECAAAAEQRGGRAESLVADVGDPAATDRIVREANDRLGRLDVLVNNAGTARVARPR